MTETAEQYYRIPDWGVGYFRVGDNGQVVIHPTKTPDCQIGLRTLVDQLMADGHRTPLHLHFPQVIEYSVQKLVRSFKRAREEFRYDGQYTPIYPIKVNQQAQVVHAVLKGGDGTGIGLEAGSKAELAAVLSVTPETGRIVCNGYKDREYVELACEAARIIPQTILVIEKYSELEILFHVLDNIRPERVPLIGIRARLHTRGTGKWEESGGDFAKFGLTAAEILAAGNAIREHGLLDQLYMLHVHIGSQITHTVNVKRLVQEAGMLYAELVRAGYPIRTIDFGGGLGVDYDGSRSPGDSSINYTMTEYANNIVFHLKDVCRQKDVPEPDLFTESGRAMVAHHAMVITDAFEQHSLFSPMPVLNTDFSEEKVLFDLKETYDAINTRNLWEYFHDAVHMKEQLHTRFNMGVLSLREKAAGEQIFWNVVRKAVTLAHRVDSRPEELEALQALMASKYVTNFSIFQSVPDAWAIRQLFPIVPIQRLGELPEEDATLADITCDSDGKINRFVDAGATSPTLRLHKIRDDRYYLGIFLTGAYQQAMGNQHNLFGRPDTLVVRVTGIDTVEIESHLPAATIRDQLTHFGYEPETIVNQLGGDTADKILTRHTYLDRIPRTQHGPVQQPVACHFGVEGIDCPRCRSALEALLADLPMVTGYSLEKTRLTVSIMDRELRPHLEDIIHQAGFELFPETDHVDG